MMMMMIVVLYQQTSQRSQTCATTPTRKCLQPSPATVITYYTTSCRNGPLVHKTVTCGNVHITLLSLLELVISLTIPLSNACYIPTYSSILLCILTELCLCFLCSRVAFCQPSIKPRLDWIGSLGLYVCSARCTIHNEHRYIQEVMQFWRQWARTSSCIRLLL